MTIADRCPDCNAYVQHREAVTDGEPGTPVMLDAYRTPGPGYVVRCDLDVTWVDDAQESYRVHTCPADARKATI